MRSALIVGNWKMHKTVAEARAYLAAAVPLLSGARAQIGLAPAFTALRPVVVGTGSAGVEVYAQNMHQAARGPFTGEIAAPMLAEIGVTGVILGHSERRRLFGENDRDVREKVAAALRAGLRPLLCVGASGPTPRDRTLRGQLQQGLADVPDERLADVVIVFEPPMATQRAGMTAAVAQQSSAFVRALIAGRSVEAAERVRILYGGRVSPDNAAALLAQPDIDGLLVGEASLDPESFAAIAACGMTAGAAPARRDGV
jgi:triosephosphate isomerase